MGASSRKITEREIRFGLKSWLVERAQPSDLIVEELGVEHGGARIDIATAASSLQGFEIKSDFDTLDRLANQMHAYHRVFDALTLVTTRAFMHQAAQLLPKWWGILIATWAPEGRLIFELHRPSSGNPRQEMRSLVALLWRDEAVSLLSASSSNRVSASAPKAHIYDLLTELVESAALRSEVIATLQRRASLRLRDVRCAKSTGQDDAPSEQDGDSLRLVATS